MDINNCPDQDILLHYMQKKLSRKQKKQVEKHLCQCDFCRKAYGISVNLLHDSSFSRWEPLPQKTISTVISHKLNEFTDKLVFFVNMLFKTPVLVPVVRNDDDIESKDNPITVQNAGLENGFTPFIKTINQLCFEMKMFNCDEKKADLSMVTRYQDHPMRDVNYFLTNAKGKSRAKCQEDEAVYFREIPFGLYELIISHQGNETIHIKFEINRTGIYENNDLS